MRVQESENRVLLTPEGLRKLTAELEHLTTVRRKEVLEQIAIARQEADGWDSQEFLDAKDQQSFVEGRILTIERLLRDAQVIQSEHSHSVVSLGSEVTVLDEAGQQERYVIGGSTEADPARHRISSESPVGRALVGHKPGDVVEFDVPDGKRALTILEIT
jgi:transcription elongation factor GreA